MSSEDLHTLTAAYALDALDDVERRRYERHLTSCPRCATELRGFLELSARLATATATEPPPGLRNSVLTAATQCDQASAPPPASRLPHRWIAVVAGAVAAAAVAAAAVSGVVAARSEDRLTASRREQREVASVLAAPDCKIVRAPIRTGGTATVAMSARMHALIFTAAGLPAAPAGQRYELWLMRPSGDTRAATLPAADGGPVMVMASAPIAGQHLGLSLERDTRPSRPTAPMLAIIAL